MRQGAGRTARRGARAAGAAAVLAVLAACTVVGPDGERTDPTPSPEVETAPEPAVAELRVPQEEVSVVSAADAASRAVAVSQAFVESAPVAVLAPLDSPEQQVRAASAAVALGAPLLLGDQEAMADELARLEVEAVLSFLPADAEQSGTGSEDGAGQDEPADDGAAQTPTPDEDSGSGSDGETDGQDDGQAGDGAGGPADGEATEVLVVPAPAQDEDLAELLGVDDVAPGALTLDAVLALDRDAPVVLGFGEPAADGSTDAGSGEDGEGSDGATSEPGTSPDDGPSATPTPGAAPTTTPTDEATDGADPSTRSTDLPETTPAEPVEKALLLSTGAVEDLAAVATARAVGAGVQLVPGGDPRRDGVVVQALAGTEDTVVALGGEFGTPEDLTWRLATARTGVELPGGGQIMFPGRRLVAMYGTPGSGALGILGEQDVTESIARVQKLTRAYRPFSPEPVVPAFEMIVTIASAEAGDDGNYSRELDPATFVPWIEAAQEAGVYVVLDLQPGRTDFLTQAQQYESLLRYPNAGLALDPEWRLTPDQVHLRQIGRVDVAEVNAVADWLATLTRENALPQKLFVLHQFSLSMITDRQNLTTTHPELATMIHVDGQGSQPAKAGTWAALRNGAPQVFWGWKNFLDEDSPMLTPEQTYRVTPLPELVTYQ